MTLETGIYVTAAVLMVITFYLYFIRGDGSKNKK